MLYPYASAFVHLAKWLDMLEQHVGGEETQYADKLYEKMSGAARPKLADSIRTWLPGIGHITKIVPMPSAEAQVTRLKDALQQNADEKRLVALLSALRDRIEDELKALNFYHVRLESAGYYKDPNQFGDDVALKFPSARDDIECAGKCLALGQGTACVFHLMGVTELGLRVFAKALDIPYAPSWESYLRQIEAKMSVPYKKKNPKWKRNEKFFREMLGDLTAVKIAWRNPTVHINRKYTPDEAEEVFRAVRTFMKHAATKLCEPQAKEAAKLLGTLG